MAKRKKKGAGNAPIRRIEPKALLGVKVPKHELDYLRKINVDVPDLVRVAIHHAYSVLIKDEDE